MAGMGLEPSPDDFRERLSDGSLLIDALVSVARFFLSKASERSVLSELDFGSNKPSRIASFE